MNQWNAHQNKIRNWEDFAFQGYAGMGKMPCVLNSGWGIRGTDASYSVTRAFRIPEGSSYAVQNYLGCQRDIRYSSAQVAIWKIRHIFKFCPAALDTVHILLLYSQTESPMRAASFREWHHDEKKSVLLVPWRGYVWSLQRDLSFLWVLFQWTVMFCVQLHLSSVGAWSNWNL